MKAAQEDHTWGENNSTNLADANKDGVDIDVCEVRLNDLSRI